MARDRFGTLRNLLQRDELDDAARSELWRLVNFFERREPLEYVSVWRPYISGFPHHFVEPLVKLGLIDDLSRLEHNLELIPGATFALSLFGEDMNEECFKELMGERVLERISRLEGWLPDPSASTVYALTDCPHLVNLRELLLKANFEGGVMEVFAGSSLFQRLKKLEITRCGLEPREFAVLFECMKGSELEALELEGNPLEAECAELFTESRSEPRLKRLDLSECGLFDEGAIALARAPMLASLEELRLTFNDLTVDALRAFTGSPQLDALRWLDVGANPTIDDEGVAFLMGSPWTRRLTHLDLSYTGMTDAGVDAIVASEHVSGLEVLDLSVNDITHAGVMALARAENLRSLRALHIDTKGIEEEVIEALLASPHLSDSAKRTATSRPHR